MIPMVGEIISTGTHFPYLAALVAQTTGPVIELGAGHYSTPMLHYMCQKRPLLTVEGNYQWHEQFAQRLRNGVHDFYPAWRKDENGNLVENDYMVFFNQKKYQKIFWDVAFVDHSPEQDRKRSVEILRSRAKFIIVHDAEPQATIYQWDGIFETFKYYKMMGDVLGYGGPNGNRIAVVSEFAEIELD